MEINVLDIAGKETGRKVELNDSIFAIEPSDHAIYLDVKQYLANQRQGTHKSKQRNEVSGSTRKLKKQKGTGTARAGDQIRPPAAQCGDPGTPVSGRAANCLRPPRRRSDGLRFCRRPPRYDHAPVL